jgi:CheY-like chemotaxis protein
MNVPANFAMVISFPMNTGTSAKRTAPARIMLVDDNQMGLRARKFVLEEIGYEVLAVGCSVEALQHFCAQPFDLIVTDYKMPRLDGIELISRIRERTPGMPIIMLSGFAEALGLDEFNTGADIVIQKNSHEVVALTRAVSRLLVRRPPVRKPVRIQTTLSRGAAAGG